jgi:hypothetical protein
MNREATYENDKRKKNLLSEEETNNPGILTNEF